MDQFDLEQLNEVFDGSVENYEVVDLMPKAKTPQMFLLKGEGIDNLVVRLMAQKEGDTLRNLTPSDKNVIVFIMTLNDKGNLGELKGGLGGNPIRAVVSIFDTVYKAINTPVVQSIMFRFPAKKMAGQERAVRRILERLLVVRGKNRFVSLPEMANHSAKYSYVVAHKKNLDISDLPGAKNISERFTKVDTAVGEAFIDTKSGKQVTKGEVVADAMFTSTNKVDTKQVIAKSKISRREVMNAQYGSSGVFKAGTSGAETYDTITNTLPSVEVDKDTALNPVVGSVNYRMRDDMRGMFAARVKAAEEIKEHLDPDLVSLPNWQTQLVSRLYKPTQGTHQEKVQYGAGVVSRINEILMGVQMGTVQETIEHVVEIIQNCGLEDDDAVTISRTFVRSFADELNRVIASSVAGYETSRLTPEQRNAIVAYTGPGFKAINNYLLGNYKPESNTLSIIEHIDTAMSESGTRLEEGVKLYRGHKLTSTFFKSALERKLYYFKNYVSTSLSPIIFTGGFADVSAEMVNPTADTDTSEIEVMQATESSTDASIGFVISGAHKIKVLIPGTETAYPQECEVMLPRGTTLRFDRVKTVEASGSYLVFASVVEPSKLDESEVVYDGDVLLETGESVPVNRFSLIETSEEVRIAHETIRRDTIDYALVSCMDINSIPEKFVL